MGALAGPLMVFGTGISIVGQIRAGRAARAEGEAAAEAAQRMADFNAATARRNAAIARRNAAVQEQEARSIRQRARFEQRRHTQAGERIKSALIAKLGASGVDIAAGAPLSLVGEQARELELENLLIGYEGEIAVQRALSQAEMDRAQSDLYRAQSGFYRLQGGLQSEAYRRGGRNIQRASYLQAGSTLLTGFGSAYTSSPQAQAWSKGVPFRSAMTATGRSPSGGFVFGPYRGR